MKTWLLAILFVGFAAAVPSAYRKQADSDYLEKQKKVLKLFVGLGVDVDEHEHKDFPFGDAKFYMKPEYVEKFLKKYQRGFLNRDGVFTLHCHKSRHDTYTLFDLFFFAKDFDTFYQIAEWAKNELHPVQFALAFTMAVSHRPDCQGIILPPLYEVFPSFFVPEEVMTKAKHAKLHDVKFRQFEVNNTGWEWSWHKDMTSGVFKSGNKWNGDDREVWMSYFREDADLNNWYAYHMIFYIPFLNPEKYDIKFERRGEFLYAWHKWMLNRYNLERYSNKLPPAKAFDFDVPLIGYDSHLSDGLGRSFLPRPDGMVPAKGNPDFWDIDLYEQRYYNAISGHKMFNVENNTFVDLDEKHGAEYLGRALYGANNIFSSKYYRPYFLATVHYIDDMVTSSNNREYTRGPMGTLMTSVRDPAFWQVIANVDNMFNSHFNSLHPYTKEDLTFDGVKINSVEFDRLVTFFERHEFELTNGVPFHDSKDRVEKKYMASQFRINHKPFTYKVNVHSDKATDAMVRVMIGPKYDSEHRPLSINQARHMFYHLDIFQTKLSNGDNVIERNSHEIPHYGKTYHFRDMYQKVQKAIETKEPFYYSQISHTCGFPHHMVLPRGSRSGREFVIYVIVTPFDSKHSIEHGICEHQMLFDQHSVFFPMDRPIPYEFDFKVPNSYFQDVNIFLKTDVEMNRT